MTFVAILNQHLLDFIRSTSSQEDKILLEIEQLKPFLLVFNIQQVLTLQKMVELN